LKLYLFHLPNDHESHKSSSKEKEKGWDMGGWGFAG